MVSTMTSASIRLRILVKRFVVFFMRKCLLTVNGMLTFSIIVCNNRLRKSQLRKMNTNIQYIPIHCDMAVKCRDFMIFKE